MMRVTMMKSHLYNMAAPRWSASCSKTIHRRHTPHPHTSHPHTPHHQPSPLFPSLPRPHSQTRANRHMRTHIIVQPVRCPSTPAPSPRPPPPLAMHLRQVSHSPCVVSASLLVHANLTHPPASTRLCIRLHARARMINERKSIRNVSVRMMRKRRATMRKARRRVCHAHHQRSPMQFLLFG